MAKTRTAEKKKKELDIEVKVSDMIDYMKMTGAYQPMMRDVIIRKIACEAAAHEGLKVTDSELQRGADAFRHLNKLHKKDDMHKWLEHRGITVDAFEQYIETNILMNKLKDTLVSKAGKEDFLKNEHVMECIRSTAYEEWLHDTLKEYSL